MPRYIQLVIFLCFNGLYAQTQHLQVDSLLHLLNTQPAPDSTRLTRLSEICYYYAFADPHKGLEMGRKAIELADQLGVDHRKGVILSNMATNHNSLGNNVEALRLYGEARELYRKQSDQAGQARTWFNSGLIHYNLSDFGQALSAHRHALAIFKELKDSTRAAHTLNSIGVTYMALGNYPMALEKYLQARKMNSSKAPNLLAGNISNNLGLIYKNLGDYNRSLLAQVEALRHYKAIGYQQGMSNSIGNIGIVYDLKGNPGTALPYFKKAYRLAASLNYVRGMASHLNSMAGCYIAMGEYDLAQPCLEEALEKFSATGEKASVAQTLNSLGKLYQSAPEKWLKGNQLTATDARRKAIEFFEKSAALSDSVKDLATKAVAVKNVSSLYEQNGQFERALNTYKLYVASNDSILNKNQLLAISKMELEDELDVLKSTLEKEHATDMKRQQLINKLVMAIGALTIIAGFIVFRVLKKKRDALATIKETQLKAQVIETEMKALRAQLNPHFIFNSLNAIGDYIVNNNKSEADKYLTSFAGLMRMILEFSEQKYVPLSEDLQTLELYLQLEKMRMNHSFSFNISVDPMVDQEQSLVPPLILQPIVENSIRHGLAPRGSSGMIRINISKRGEELVCTIEDNGVGFSPGRGLPKSDFTNGRKSYGMRITRSRLEHINRELQTGAELKICPVSAGSKVELILPYMLSN